MNPISTKRSPEETLSVAKRLLYRYAPDTQLILGYAEFVMCDSVQTVACSVENSRVFIKLNRTFIDTISEQELAVILYTEAVRLVLGHVSGRLYSNKQVSLYASDLLCFRMALLTDIGDMNPIYGKIHRRVTEMEDTVRGLYRNVYHKEYDYKNVSLEILYRLLNQNGGSAVNGDDDGNSSNDNTSASSTYINDNTRASEWNEDNVVTQEVAESAMSGGKEWGSDDINGMMKCYKGVSKSINIVKIVRQFLNTSMECGYTESRFKRNRRFGLLYPGYIRDYKSKILVAFDVSNSMRDEDMYNTINLITKLGKKIQLDYCYWSTRCSQPVPLTKKDIHRRNLTFMKGGGTDCGCVFRMLDKCRTRYDSIVIVSDMEFHDDFKLSPKCKARKILWVSTQKANKPPQKYAKCAINIEDITY